MDFEERIEKLRERHEALAQSVELLQHQISEHQHSIVLQGENLNKLAIESAVQQKTLGSVLNAMKELIELVAGHERRIGNLEENR